jgi:hypothetical protein
MVVLMRACREGMSRGAGAGRLGLACGRERTVKHVRVGMGRILKVLMGGARVDAEVVGILELEVEVETGDAMERTMRLVIGSAV